MKRGILESVATIICFSGLIAYLNNYYMLIPMLCILFVYLGFKE